MIFRSSVSHTEVIEIRVENYDDRVEILVRNMIDGKEVVNKHRVYGRLKSIKTSSIDKTHSLYKNVIRFKNLINCINIVIETMIENSSSIPGVSISLEPCIRIRYDKDIDELFSSNINGLSKRL